ncbi:[FeFe] hydrogenase H-cluster radical SAM maturase HydE [Selenomonadales bacterium OttesenSCG-928-I06]|nr:[FeFe] hydrogenase H-cluster radical SAM maturase HydE [Selenomonadales bacterium OttesenSCG-928-I06]
MTQNSSINSIIEKAEKTHELNKEDILSLLQNRDESIDKEIFLAADRVRKHYVGDEIHLRGLIEFSNICKQNCCYCGLRRENKNVSRYRIDPQIIINLAQKAKQFGYKTLVLQSGEDEYFTEDKMIFIISEIKKLDMAITLSIGEKPRETYQAYKKAGADRFLLRIETTDKELYNKLDPGMIFENRVRCLQDLKELGFELGTGTLVGLPGQTLESLADDIMFFKTIKADMIGIGPFIANEDTPLMECPNGDFDLSTKVMAITRMLLPDINIPATTAMETLKKDGRLIALQRGANVVMPNVTLSEYSQNYQLYPGKSTLNDSEGNIFDELTKDFATIGRTISFDYGISKRYIKNKLTLL